MRFLQYEEKCNKIMRNDFFAEKNKFNRLLIKGNYTSIDFEVFEERVFQST